MGHKQQTLYEERIQSRSYFHFLIGLIPRILPYIYFSYCRYIARKKGAKIGKNVLLHYQLAKKLNNKISIGDKTSIDTIHIDTRAKLKIGNNVIIGNGVEIITCSHNIDSSEWEFKPYGLVIEDYVWLATKSTILPSCRIIKRGAVIGAFSVVVKNVDEMNVVAGNPASHLKNRKEIHRKVCIESLRGGDLTTYVKAYIKRSKQ